MPGTNCAPKPEQHAQKTKQPEASHTSNELAQPWRKFITLNDGKSLEASSGEVRLQLERDQHKGVGGPLCQPSK
jgi:hypothetical protein